MKAQDSPEWPPFGWTFHSNVLKSGRKIEYYVNPETGQKFFSKDDLIHHARVQGIEIGHSQPPKRKLESDSENKLQIAVVDEPPDWLPHDWIMEMKTFSSGRKRGKSYKCFLEVATGRKFYTKPQVFKYLGNVKHGSSKLKEAPIGVQPSKNVGSSKPKEGSVNAEPLSKVGLSKPKEASISTQSLSMVGSSKLKEASVHTQRSSKVVFETCPAEDLPPGWVKEVKITKSRYRTRRDPFYTDPVTGFVFRSKKDVERYLETGKRSRSAFLPKKKLSIDQDSPSPATEGDEIVGIPARGQFLSGEHSVDGEVCSDVDLNALATLEASINVSEKILQAETVIPLSLTAEISSQNRSGDHTCDNVDGGEVSGLTNESNEKQDQDSVKDGKESGCQQKTQSNLRKSKPNKGLNLHRRTSKRLAGVEPIREVDQVSRIIGPKIEADPVSGIIEQHDAADNAVLIVEALQDPTLACSNEGGAVNVSADKPNLNSETDSKLEEFIENKTCSSKAGAVIVRVDEPILHSEADTKREFIESKKKERSESKAKNSSKATKRKMPNLPRRSSKRLAGMGAQVPHDSVSAGQAPQNVTSSRNRRAVSACPKSDDLPAEVNLQHDTEAAEQKDKVSQQGKMKQIHQQGVRKEQSEGLDTEKVVDKISESKISPPFEKFLADPCLEFAIKTLTDAIPFETAAYSMLLQNPADNINQKKNHVKDVEGNSNRTQIKPSKSKIGKKYSPRRPSKQKTEFQFNQIPNSVPLEMSADAANVKSGKTKAVRRSGSARKNATGGSRNVETGPGVHHGSPDIRISQEWRVNKSKQSLYLNFSDEHSQKPELQPFFHSPGEQSQRPESQSSFLGGDLWSDPCLEFAFKTLTGSLPLQDHLPSPGYLQQQVNSLQPQRENCVQQPVVQQPVETHLFQRAGNIGVGNLAMPDYCFPSFSQTDISAHFDYPEKQPRPSCSLAVLPSGNAKMPNCTMASQPPHVDGSKGLHGKVRS